MNQIYFFLASLRNINLVFFVFAIPKDLRGRFPRFFVCSQIIVFELPAILKSLDYDPFLSHFFSFFFLCLSRLNATLCGRGAAVKVWAT